MLHQFRRSAKRGDKEFLDLSHPENDRLRNAQVRQITRDEAREFLKDPANKGFVYPINLNVMRGEGRIIWVAPERLIFKETPASRDAIEQDVSKPAPAVAWQHPSLR